MSNQIASHFNALDKKLVVHQCMGINRGTLEGCYLSKTFYIFSIPFLNHFYDKVSYFIALTGVDPFLLLCISKHWVFAGRGSKPTNQ